MGHPALREQRGSIDLEWPYRMQGHPSDPNKLGTQEMLERVLSPNAPYTRIGFGGPKGGGKSYGARGISFTLTYKIPIVVVLIRSRLKTLDRNHIIPAKNELREFIDAGFVDYNAKEKIFYMPSGGMVQYMHCATEKDVDQFDGVSADLYIFEEAGHFSKTMIDGIIKNNRASDIAINRGAKYRPRSLFTFNWGGPGHNYLRRVFWDRIYTENEKPDQFFFIFADIRQNRALLDRNPEYIQNLRQLPTRLRDAYLTGDPDALVGTVFMIVPQAHYVRPQDFMEKWEDQFTGETKWLVPEDWRIMGSLDAGYGAPTSYGHYAVSPEGRRVKLFTYYWNPAEQGDQKLRPPAHVSNIMKRIRGCEFTRGVSPEFIASDSYAFQHGQMGVQSGDVTWEDLFAEEGIPLYPVKYERKTALQALHTSLHFEFDENNDELIIEPKLQFLEGYNDATIEELRSIQPSRTDPDDIDSDGDDHAIDETKNMNLCAEAPPEFVPVKEKQKTDPKADYGSRRDRLEEFMGNMERAIDSFRNAL